MSDTTAPLRWLGILRLGLVQAALGSIVVLVTSTLNRVMVVEYALPAVLPGMLVALHYAVQLVRPRFGHGSDVGGRRTPWIVGGMGLLAVGAVLCAFATVNLARSFLPALALAITAYALVGFGVGAAGTSLLALMAKRVPENRRAAAATIMWILMIAGFAITSTAVGHFLDPFTPQRLLSVTGTAAAIALLIALAALWKVEGAADIAGAAAHPARGVSFQSALRRVWSEPQARGFTVFVFVSMLAYSAQELLLEPFAGLVFGYTLGRSAQLAGLWHGAVLAGMVVVGVACSASHRLGSLRAWTIGGCIVSAAALLCLAAADMIGPAWPLRATVAALGAGNGAFAVAAIGSMMELAAREPGSAGVRMGLWGAAQAVAFALGGVFGTFTVDAVRYFFGSPVIAFAVVFGAEALLFLVAARFAVRAGSQAAPLRGAISAAETFDVVVIGGGPSGATAATDLARQGHRVCLLDRAGRIKPCGGAIPPKLIEEFDIPESLLVARVNSARMISPAQAAVDMPIDGGFVGMVDRETFDEWLRRRAASAGAQLRHARFERITRDGDEVALVHFRESGQSRQVRARAVIGADGAMSAVAKQCIPGANRIRYVAAYHEIVRVPAAPGSGYSPTRCDVYYQGKLSPDFYAWIFPHGATASVGVGSANKGFSLRGAVLDLRALANLAGVETLRREGAPIPMKPLRRWDNGRDIVLAGDAAGVVAPASGEGIYYAMAGGRFAALAAAEYLRSGDPRALRSARRRFMKAHGTVFWVLGIMQRFWYSTDRRRERFVSICKDPDVQRLTWQAYMHKKLVRAKPLTHIRIFAKDMAHLLGLARA
jgi:geranylgeranyl reductase